ncbi:membrane protein [Lactococcus hodotermopsidis]|uniref:Membrane protein n=1 Tax=Pseudolactococcus hodotermopsidis TaxID=2709157 RepID=A0A6A0BBG6_9LACT|nr:QueT transporter family protein [Lactococcus hodotermopsidis]GFH42176.1 membrane protein [Lactococcus hodotermopsidis]
MNNKNIKFLATSAIITALYVTLTLVFGAFSFGIVNFRIASMLNHVIFINKKYAFAIILGCGIANSTSPLGLMDVLVGVSMNAIALGLTILITSKMSYLPAKLAVNTLTIAALMFMVALELVYAFHMPFLATYGTVALGQFVSVGIGAVLYQVVFGRTKLAEKLA